MNAEEDTIREGEDGISHKKAQEAQKKAEELSSKQLLVLGHID